MAQTQHNHVSDGLYKASKKTPEFLKVPAMKYLMIDGTGDPNTSKQFQDSIQALYSLAYGIKFGRKKRGEESDYKIPPLEGLWWSDDPKNFMDGGDKSKWQWRLMISEPDFVSQKDLTIAAEEAGKKKALPALPSVRLEKFAEGPAVQMMHVGPYSTEHTSIARLHDFAKESGYEITGKFHEIYLSDPSKTAPEKIKTIIRQPVAKQSS